MIIRYLLSQILAMFFVLLTWALSPLLALCYRVVDSREWLIKPLLWFQTFDNPLDEWRTGDYWKSCNWLQWNFDKPFHRYLARVFWLCRNPAYGFAQYMFGIVPKGVPVTIEAGTWDSATTNWHYIKWDNCFHFRAQFYWYKNIYLRINIGWKPHAGFDKMMITGSFNPFRAWRV